MTKMKTKAPQKMTKTKAPQEMTETEKTLVVKSAVRPGARRFILQIQMTRLKYQTLAYIHVESLRLLQRHQDFLPQVCVPMHKFLLMFVSVVMGDQNQIIPHVTSVGTKTKYLQIQMV